MTHDESPASNEAAPGRQRIAKLMARVGLCSRREAEAWIVDGRVSVNGNVLTSPAIDVALDDTILVDGAPLPQAQKTRLFLFHKPRGLVTSDHDPEGRATVAEFLREHWPDGPRVVTIGRLDINTEGLLLLTNDGGLARLLELPKTGWVRRYRVRAKGETDQGVLDGLRAGVTIDDIAYAGIEATLDRVQGANVWLTMGLREGKNREVKRVLESIGLEVNRLIRLSFGPFQLGDLPEGGVEEVRTRVLRDQLGAALAAAAGVAFEDAVVAPPDSKPVRADRKPARTAGAERVNKGERPPASARGSRDERGRGGDRPLRRSRESKPPPVRERPVTGTRKHVSTLRAARSEAVGRGPRQRIERADVSDRKDRTVRVERLVDTRPARPQRARAGAQADAAPRDARRERPRDPSRARDDRDARRSAPGSAARRDGRPDRPDSREAPSRAHASPSALAKRARVAKSGGDDEARGGDRRNSSPPGRRDRAGGETTRPQRDRTQTRRPDQGARRDARGDGKRNDRERAGPGDARRAPRSEGSEKRFGRKPSAPAGDHGPRGTRASAETRKEPRPARDRSGGRSASAPGTAAARRGPGARKRPGGGPRPPRGKPASRPKR